jgi:hypothetical protein
MGEERKLYKVLVEKSEGNRRLVNGRMGSEWILERLAGGCGVDSLAQDRDRWRDIVNTMTNLRVLAPRI